jgi:hypothetical protein
MRTAIRNATLLILLLVPAGHSVALPDCNYSRLHCGVSCRYQQDWGGACSGTAVNETSYCWSELVRSDYGSWWPSCHEEAYDACCDELNPWNP